MIKLIKIISFIFLTLYIFFFQVVNAQESTQLEMPLPPVVDSADQQHIMMNKQTDGIPSERIDYDECLACQ